jgi:hypothetical protein
MQQTPGQPMQPAAGGAKPAGEKKTNWLMWIIIALVCIGILGLAYWLIF